MTPEFCWTISNPEWLLFSSLCVVHPKRTVEVVPLGWRSAAQGRCSAAAMNLRSFLLEISPQLTSIVGNFKALNHMRLTLNSTESVPIKKRG